ncbi:MAG: hypothetical protein JWP87_99 [Labilithrix sp.]|nr:hypothetical protein [Labilithrix sp.]
MCAEARVRVGGSDASCDAPLSCSINREGDRVRVKMSVSFKLSEAVDGETYRFRITAKSGGLLVDFNKPVTFTRQERPCDEPCRNATVDL